MTELKQVRVSWSNWVGGPGVSTFYFETQTEPPLADLRTLWSTLATKIASGITIQVQNTGVTIDTAIGKPVGTWSGPAQAPLTTSGGINYAGPVGGLISWRTGFFANGREVRGRTFYVPLNINAYDSTGTLSNADVSAVQTALNTWMGLGGVAQRVWSRKSNGSAAVHQAVAVDKAVVLKSRRAGG